LPLSSRRTTVQENRCKQVLRVPELSRQVRFRLVERPLAAKSGELGNILATSAAIGGSGIVHADDFESASALLGTP
jgi:hypothetical protein